MSAPRKIAIAAAILAASSATCFFVGCSSSDDAGSSSGTLPDASTDGTIPEGASADGGEGGTTDGGDGGGGGDSLPTGPRDRAGRAYVSLLLVASGDDREDYNGSAVDQTSATDPTNDAGGTVGGDFQSALVLLDSLDGVTDWNGGARDAGADDAGVYPHPLVNAWVGADAIVIDPNKPFSATGYLDIEQNGAAHTTSGGRWLGDDALDKTMSFLVKKSLTGISDGVNAPAKAPTMTFPYLAEPF